MGDVVTHGGDGWVDETEMVVVTEGDEGLSFDRDDLPWYPA